MNVLQIKACNVTNHTEACECGNEPSASVKCGEILD